MNGGVPPINAATAPQTSNSIWYRPQYNWPTDNTFKVHRFKGDDRRTNYAKYSFAAAVYYLYTIGNINREDHERLHGALQGRSVPALSIHMHNWFTPVQITFTPVYDEQTNALHPTARYTGNNCLQQYALKQCQAAVTYLQSQHIPFPYPIPTVNPHMLVINMATPLTTITPVHHLPIQQLQSTSNQQHIHRDEEENLHEVDDIEIVQQMELPSNSEVRIFHNAATQQSRHENAHQQNDNSSIHSTLSESTSSVPSHEPSIHMPVAEDDPESVENNHVSYTSSDATDEPVARMPVHQQRYQLPQPDINFVNDFRPPQRLPDRKKMPFHTKKKFTIYTKGKSYQQVLLEQTTLFKRYWTSFETHMKNGDN
jgi:hypothetical protein